MLFSCLRVWEWQRVLVLKTCLPAKPHLHLQKILKGMILHEHLPNLLDIFHTIKRPEWHSDSKCWLWCKEDHQRKNQLKRLYFLTGTHSTFPYMPCAAESEWDFAWASSGQQGGHCIDFFFLLVKQFCFSFIFPTYCQRCSSHLQQKSQRG